MLHQRQSPPPPQSTPPAADAANAIAALELSFEATSRGGGTLRVRYRGPIAWRPGLWIRFGERRKGCEWIATRDIPMLKTGSQASATALCSPGAPLEGACLAFFALDEAGEEIWDNGGRAFGYYRYDIRTGTIEVR